MGDDRLVDFRKVNTGVIVPPPLPTRRRGVQEGFRMLLAGLDFMSSVT